jgi:hypothetical protein
MPALVIPGVHWSSEATVQEKTSKWVLYLGEKGVHRQTNQECIREYQPMTNGFTAKYVH